MPLCFERGAEADHDHHVVPRSRGGTKTVPLCARCHGLAHHRRKNMATGSMVAAGIRANRAPGAPWGAGIWRAKQTPAEWLALLVRKQAGERVCDLAAEVGLGRHHVSRRLRALARSY